MKALILWPVLLAAMIFSTSSLAQDQGKEVKVVEYCGNGSSATLKYQFMRWDCTHVRHASLRALEVSVLASVSVLTEPEGTDMRIYESRDPDHTAWIFANGDAVRYRAIYEDGVWQGVGVTTYCSSEPDLCRVKESLAVSNIPSPLVLKLGPPPPEAPTIEQ